MEMKTFLLTCSISIFVSGCSSSYDNTAERQSAYEQKRYEASLIEKEQTMEIVPDWFSDPLLSDENGFYAMGLGQAPSLSSALKLAKIDAKKEMAVNVSKLIGAQEQIYSKTYQNSDRALLEPAVEFFINELEISAIVFDRKERALVNDKFVYFVRAYLPVKAIIEAQKVSQFSEDLEIEKVEGQISLMQRVNSAKAEIENKKGIELKKKTRNLMTADSL